MALVRCRECGKKISEFCSVCPKCGCPMERRPNEAVDETANQPNAVSTLETKSDCSQEKNRRIIRIISAVILAVVGVCLFAAVFSQSDEIKDAVYLEWYIDALGNDTFDDAVVEYIEEFDVPQDTFDPDGFVEYQKEKLSGEILKKCLPFYIGGIGCFAIAGYLLISLKKYPLMKHDQTQDPHSDFS